MDNFTSLLLQGAEELGLGLTLSQAEQLQTFYGLLLEWNRKMNLTAIEDEKEVVVKHFLDSLSCCQAYDFTQVRTVIDVGTGAGFPGVPLKIYQPHLKLVLLDALQKRLNFLQAVTETLGLLDVSLLHGRAEDMARECQYREQFDLVCARAVAPMRVLAELCLPFARPGGFFLAQKGPEVEVELQEAAQAINLLGGKVKGVRAFKLPLLELQRTIVVVEKTSSTPLKYPRRAGIPEKRPL